MSESGKAEPQSQPRPASDDAPKQAEGGGDGGGQQQQQQQQQQHQHDFANPTLGIIGNASRRTSYSGATSPSREGTPPPLPPRPRPQQLGVPSITRQPSRPQLVSKATTQLSVTNTQAFGSDARDTRSSTATSDADADVDDSASIRSYAPTIAGTGGESILGEIVDAVEKSKQEQTLLRSLGHGVDGFNDAESQSMFPPDPDFELAFDRELDDVDEMAADGSNQEQVMQQWRAKLKHFMILSSAGKPIYSRHGDDQLITNYMGVVQTLISFYQSTNDTLRGFTAGDVRFVVMSKGPLNLVAITRLPESDSQLRAQLDALYMQILSTLTLPSVERMFAARANYDLRRPLQGTEILLSALADGFTRGSPSTLLSALECLKLRKSHRNTINNTLLKTRSENLLYGLIVASGKLVSVVRPKKHSLHPGDLHLIFNMLFEAGSVKAGGGENWIPLCLPGFNNTGYLYMYVSFLNLDNPGEQMEERPRTRDGGDDEVAVLLISANKESFFEMRKMRDDLVEALKRNNSLTHITTAIRAGRPSTTDLVPGTPLRHFLYKSRSNVQFCMPSYSPSFPTPVATRRLLSLYAHLHAALHARPVGVKVHYQTEGDGVGVGWSTAGFEVYGVAAPGTERGALAMGVLRVVQWVRREEERVFILGGAVF